MDVKVAQTGYRHRGGADRVTTALARCFDAPVVTDVPRAGSVPADVEVVTLRRTLADRAVDRLPIPGELTKLVTWSNVPEFRDADVVVGSGLAPGWYVPEDDQVTVEYIHATPRAQTDRFQADADSLPRQAYAVTGRILYGQRSLPDRYVANSEVTARRIERHWRVPRERIRVVYPPVDVDRFSPDAASEAAVVPAEPYYLTLSRLHHLKRVDEVIEAFAGLDRTLLVAGDGPQREELAELARGSENVRLLGRVSEAEKRALLAGARAHVMNTRSENFGIVPIEAMASGTPVLGVRDGFTQAQITDGENGYVFDRGPASLREAVRRFEREGVRWGPEDLRAFARRFSGDRFAREMRDVVEEACEEASVTPRWPDADA